MKRWAVVGAAVAVCLTVWVTAWAQPTSERLVTSNQDSGAGTLREALEFANESDSGDVIRFAAPMTIQLRSPLPAIEDDSITIDASDGEPSADIAPQVWLDGASAGDAAGLEILAAGAVVRGLGVVGFARYGVGIVGAEAVDAVIEGNWLGLRADGEIAPNRLSGLAVLSGARGAVVRNNRIGGNSSSERPTGHGIVVGGGGTHDVTLENNIIGIGPDGASAPNDDGILIVDSAQAMIRNNTIGNSRVAGIEIRETREAVFVDGNRIGVRRDSAAAPNDVGLFLGPGSAGAEIGAQAPNIVAANRVGVAVEQGAREAAIENNWIGLAPAPGDAAEESALPQAIIRPNDKRGVSIIAGAAEIQLRNNVVAAGEFGVVIDGAATTRISLTRNVIAGSRQGPTTAAIDVRGGAEISIGGGEPALGNHVCGAEVGIRVANVEEALLGYNAIGAGAASRVTFDSDARMEWGVRLEDGTVRAQVQQNDVTNAAQAGIAVVGDAAQHNLLTLNRFRGNALDIDLGADGRSVNDAEDRDDGPNGRLNYPLIQTHEVETFSATSFVSTFSGTTTPGTYVDVYELNGSRWSRIAKSGRAERDGNWKAITTELPGAPIRALAVAGAGDTSEFSPLFLPAQRVKLQAGVNQIGWTGPQMPITEAMAPIQRSIKTVWRWHAAEARWQGWSPHVSFGADESPDALTMVRTGDVLRLDLAEQPPQPFFVPAGGELDADWKLSLAQGHNEIAWLGGRVDALQTLQALDALDEGLIGNVWQWDGQEWQLIWPHLLGAWDPMAWQFAALWLRATRAGELRPP